MAPESPGVLRTRETAVAAGGAWHFASQEGGYESGTLRVRRGLAPRLEGALETSAYHYEEGGGLTSVTLRGGIKYCAAGRDARRCILAFTTGAGAGTYDHGVLFGADLGLVLGWENPYLVPFLGVRLAFVVPGGVRAVDDGQGVMNIPGPNFTGTGTAGLRLPLPFRPPGTPGFSLIAAYEFVEVVDADKGEDVHVFAGAAEIDF